MKLEQIKNALRKLAPDFAQRVAPVYEVLKWEWSPLGQIAHIPDAKEIEKVLLDSIEGLTDEWVSNGSGGLTAYYSLPDENEPGHYGLNFIVEQDIAFD